MNVYLLTQDESNGYDTYVSVVVAAKSADNMRARYTELGYNGEFLAYD